MQIPKGMLTLTKAEAATRQVEAAIAALCVGHFDLAVTLAGAAEGMFDRSGPHLFKYLREHPKARDLNEAKQWVPHLNRTRDWLKHSGDPEPMQIGRAAAVEMITRAASKLETWTPPIEEFRTWLLADLDEAFSD
jgi:hypothetical protein